MSRLSFTIPAAILLAASAFTQTVAPAAAPAPVVAPAPSPNVAVAPTALYCAPAVTTTLNATLWQQTSSEYQALTHQAYRSARRLLPQAVTDTTWTAIPEIPADASQKPAIVLDIDETVLDTSSHQARLIKRGQTYTSDNRLEYTAMHQGRAIPAALDFLKFATKSVQIFYLTNRVESEHEATVATLRELGFPLDANGGNVVFRGPGDPRDKTGRRLAIARRYRVVMLFGDDLNDFVDAADHTLAERAATETHYQDWFGVKWFILPNAGYGSWDDAVVGPHVTPCADFAKRVDALQTDDRYVPPPAMPKR